MKHFLFLVLTTLLLTTSTQAQDFDDKFQKKPVQFGFDFGLGYANQWGDAYDPYGEKGVFSFKFGIDLDINFAEYSFLEIGMSFNRKGCRISSNEWVVNGGPWELYDGDKTTANLFYLEWPVLYGISIPIDRKVSWKFLVGPYFACGVAGDRKFDFNSDENKESLTLISSFSDDHDYGYRRFDMGGKIETGIEINKLSFLVSYELGLYDVMTSKKYHDLDARNSCIMGIVSFRY